MSDRKADIVARDLLRRIVRGELKKGSLLPVEDDLAKGYDVNRSVIREAIKLLEVHELVRPVRRRGTEVLDPLATFSADVVVAMLRPEPARIDLAVLHGVLDTRATLDAHMMELVCANRTKADLELLEALLDKVEKNKGAIDAYMGAHAELSLAFARATHNPIYPMLAHWNRRVVAELADLFRPIFAGAEAHAAGLGIVITCIRKRDGAAARTLVTEFHKWLNPRLLAAAALANGEPLRTALKEVS
jgi:DNA-binding FadR family transcriptional regulator